MNTDNLQVRYRPFAVKFFGPGNVRGSRIKIVDLRHETSETITYDHNGPRALDQAAAFIESRGIKLEAMALTANDSGILLLSKDFSTPLKD